MFFTSVLVAKSFKNFRFSLGKKLTATGDKLASKKVAKVLKKYYKVLAGDSIQKILQKFKSDNLTLDNLKRLNADHGLEIKPGKQIRVA